jgi:hypothetical protein
LSFFPVRTRFCIISFRSVIISLRVLTVTFMSFNVSLIRFLLTSASNGVSELNEGVWLTSRRYGLS